jgi:hypothetical protein
MQYFIRPFRKIFEEKMIGPYGHFEVVEVTEQLRAKGLPFFVADERGVVVLDKAVIRTSRFE